MDYGTVFHAEHYSKQYRPACMGEGVTTQMYMELHVVASTVPNHSAPCLYTTM